MRRSLNIHATTSQNVTLDSLMLKVFQSMARKKDSGLTSDDIIVAMRRQNPYKFISNDVYDLIHSALGTEGVDVTSFRNFAARIISENVENYLNEYMEALQVGNEGCLTRYRLEMLFCQEIGAKISHTDEAFDSLEDDSVITVETLWRLLEDRRRLLSSLVRHIFRTEINADCGDDILDRFTSTTADMLSKRRSHRCSCCNLL
ncbi:hypothetical protein BOX15_Mlig028515g2 [Macrostomum lignano]|uniref:Uncharacterized protein n=1 Tax=Macrostomum lignano TaxID=282301 RepID=A0A267G7S0_9PLAT|nr:hypothetical protein BOX15_Mlig028515g5 [Macrostomum lignano]PAA82080.1 hypothetical protein BOX15_Mlig028515g2 [Macrostomum lignano]